MRNANGKAPERSRSSSTSNGGGSNVSRTPPSASSSSTSPSGSSATTTPQPLQLTAESINSQSSASTPIVPTRPTNEGGRINRVLASLLDVNADESVQGGQVPEEILDHLKSFIQKQEEFNQRLKQRIEENINQSQKGREKKSRRLPNALTVSLTLFHLLVFTFFRILFIIIFFRSHLKFQEPPYQRKEIKATCRPPKMFRGISVTS